MYESTYSQVKAELSELIKKAAESLNYKIENVEGTIALSKEIGDISSNLSFRFAKEMKKSPDSIAKEISSKIEKPSYIKEISVENGFINFHFDRIKFATLVLNNILIIKNVLKESGIKRERVIIEYTSVNPNKPWHIGHLRNSLLGDSISNIYEALGYEVERGNYIDDLGLQMAESMWWYLNKNNKPDKKFDHWLGEEYVKVNKAIDDPDIKNGVQNMLSLMSLDGTYESKMSREVVTACVKAQYETAAAFSVYHNLLIWEGDIVKQHLLEKALKLLMAHKFIKVPKEGDYANCTIIDLLEIKDLPEELKGLKETAKVLIRSNGTPTYLAKDIAFHMWKLGIIDDTFKYSVFMKQENGKPLYTTSQEGKKMDFSKAKIAINVIGSQQSHPQSIIRLLFGNIGKKEFTDNIKHLAYGEVELQSGTLSGRKGTWFGYSADDLLRETELKAQELISSRFKLSKEEEQKIAKSVSLAAIKFEFLRLGPEKKIVFSWENALNFEGNSGPYAQYMYARATRILEEAPKELSEKKSIEIINITDAEFALVKALSKQTEIMEKAAKELRPNVITEYINELAHNFSTFYELSPILKASSESDKLFRLHLTLVFKSVIKEMLELIGIEPLSRM